MNRHLLQNGVVLLELHSLGSVLAVLGGHVTASAGQTTGLHFRALEDDLHSVAFNFFSHGFLLSYNFNVLPIDKALSNSLLQSSIESNFINETKTSSTDLKANPALLFYIVEFLAEQIDVKASLCTML